MAKKKRLFAAILVFLIALVLARPAYFLAAWFSLLPIKYYTVGKPSYSRARGVADPFMAKAADGPWEYSNGNFILDFDGSSTGSPTWVFRYVNPRTGQKSIRIYVPIPEYRVHHTDRALGLDQLPLHGRLPR